MTHKTKPKRKLVNIAPLIAQRDAVVLIRDICILFPNTRSKSLMCHLRQLCDAALDGDVATIRHADKSLREAVKLNPRLGVELLA